MALSVLMINPDQGLHGLYDSEKKVYIDTGSQWKMEQEKDRIEREEQDAANKDYFEQQKEKEVAELMTAGLSRRDALSQLGKLKPHLL